MRRLLASLTVAALFAGGALALAQSDVFDPQAITAREKGSDSQRRQEAPHWRPSR